ncbi:hypothetical protein LCGC14_1249590 [marine sediment metagenome]|uniref:Uncharacterized protein n=1 Tax=marine sediment metagenome TaxID=412755 RepID=A0A0F9NKQ9_9ZZZZ
MTRKHFRVATRIVSLIPDKDERKRTAVRFATLFRQFNDRFDSGKFFRACKLNRYT